MGRVTERRMGVVASPGQALAAADAPAGVPSELDGPSTSRWGYDRLGRLIESSCGNSSTAGS